MPPGTQMSQREDDPMTRESRHTRTRVYMSVMPHGPQGDRPVSSSTRSSSTRGYVVSGPDVLSSRAIERYYIIHTALCTVMRNSLFGNTAEYTVADFDEKRQGSTSQPQRNGKPSVNRNRMPAERARGGAGVQ